MPEARPREARDFCVYCGGVDDLTDDHVPPQGIFPKPRPPGGLVKVRACRACNGGASKDDEYFRLMLCLSQDVGESPEAQKHWEPILKSLTREQARGMASALFRSIHPVQAMTWGGVHLGPKIGFDVDLERISRVIERTVRGLHFHELNRRPAEGSDVLVHCDETLIRLPPQALGNARQKIILPLAGVEPKVVAPGVFSYRFLVAQDKPAASAWALTFYERKSFLAIVTPVDAPASPTSE
jgi:hypothetical protein